MNRNEVELDEVNECYSSDHLWLWPVDRLTYLLYKLTNSGLTSIENVCIFRVNRIILYFGYNLEIRSYLSTKEC